MPGRSVELEGAVLETDYVNIDDRSVIRVTLKQEGGIQTLYDTSFYPYFLILPYSENLDAEELSKVVAGEGKETSKPHRITKLELSFNGAVRKAFKVEVLNTRHVSKLSEAMSEFGERYEYDILFWKRYLIDKQISPLSGVKIDALEENGRLLITKIEKADARPVDLRQLSFDIETYNPLGEPRPEKDPVIMISYSDGKRSGVMTTKQIDKDFVKVFKDEGAMIKGFIDLVNELDVDLIVGYNSSNFDIPYLMKRAEKNGIKFNLDRYGEGVKQEHHGLIESIKIPGRGNIDIYNVVKFISIVGASEKLIKATRFTLKEVYAAVTGTSKLMVDRRNIWQIWDGSKEDVEELAEYSLGDSVSLNKLYDFFMPLEIEIAKTVGTTLAEACVSTTGQLVEYTLMKYAYSNKEVIPNKPSEREISARLANPIEGAYVKAPTAGVYRDIVVFDFRGLYPSIIISYNIDPSRLCRDCSNYYESPNGIKFVKEPRGIIPIVLKLLITQREAVKKAYKKNPDDIFLGARSSALKILANSFYGYLGYARSRWYSRECASSVTAFGRDYITKTMATAEKNGFGVLYGDTDSCFLIRKGKSKEDSLELMKAINQSLPESMELELEDFYSSGVFVGKRGAIEGGAKKKYALLSESGRIKIKGFELVRRDWSNIARETQRSVLEAILKDGGKEKAISIVKDVIKKLREGRVELQDLVIHTQLRKSISSYDNTSPELSAAKKAISQGVKKREEIEGAMLGYIITKKGTSISEKAELEESAKDYDADYYINHQIIPSTLKILKELGVSENELKGLGSQKKLGG